MKKILNILITILMIGGGYFLFKSDIFYTPNYQRVSQVLHHPQKEISFEVDVNKWKVTSGKDDLINGESSGIALFYKEKKMIDGICRQTIYT